MTARKSSKRTFKVWAVVTRHGLNWVYVGEDARKEAIESINRAAGESVKPATLTLDPPKKRVRK